MVHCDGNHGLKRPIKMSSAFDFPWPPLTAYFNFFLPNIYLSISPHTFIYFTQHLLIYHTILLSFYLHSHICVAWSFKNHGSQIDELVGRRRRRRELSTSIGVSFEKSKIVKCLDIFGEMFKAFSMDWWVVKVEPVNVAMNQYENINHIRFAHLKT